MLGLASAASPRGLVAEDGHDNIRERTRGQSTAGHKREIAHHASFFYYLSHPLISLKERVCAVCRPALHDESKPVPR